LSRIKPPVDYESYAGMVAYKDQKIAKLRADNKALLDALKIVNRYRDMRNGISDLFHIVLPNGQVVGEIIDAAIKHSEPQ
jgi:hypothetical protein